MTLTYKICITDETGDFVSSTVRPPLQQRYRIGEITVAPPMTLGLFVYTPTSLHTLKLDQVRYSILECEAGPLHPIGQVPQPEFAYCLYVFQAGLEDDDNWQDSPFGSHTTHWLKPIRQVSPTEFRTLQEKAFQARRRRHAA